MLFLFICCTILPATVAYAEVCCDSSTANTCIMSSGKIWNPTTCTCSCNPAIEAQCIAQNRVFNSSSCTCEGCNSSIAAYCSSIGRVVDPYNCQCGGCDSMLANQCVAQQGIWNPSNCTCEIVSNPCAPQYQIAYVYSFPLTMSQCCAPGLRCTFLYTQYEIFIYGYNNIFCGMGNGYIIENGYYSVPDMSCPCY